MSTRTPHPTIDRNLALIGGRGCGKSSIAKRLARENRNFILLSTDHLLRYEFEGLEIPAIVEREGWAGFREREFEVVRKAASFERGALLDCGGGVVVDLDAEGREVFSQRKVEALRSHALVVYLARETRYLEERIGVDPNRPALSQTESFEEIMERRDPWYREAADWVLDCGEASKTELTERVLAWFYERTGAAVPE